MSTNGLILHAGAAAATYADVAAVETPHAVAEWVPIPHATLLNTVVDELNANGLEVTESAYGLWQKGARFFATLALAQRGKEGDYQTVVGIRNSHDKAFAATLGMGSRVFVCDNLAFSADIKIARKHTTNILRDLPALTNRAVAKLSEYRGFQDNRIDAYKSWAVTDEMAHDFMARTVMLNLLPTTKFPAVLKEWHEPSHEEFAPRTAWSLFNAYTEALKGAFTALPRRTMGLHGMMDAMTGVVIVPATRLDETFGDDDVVDADFEVME